jgi:hypothetical protein
LLIFFFFVNRGMFANRLGELLNHEGYEILEAEEERREDGEEWVVKVAVAGIKGVGRRFFAFHLAKKEFGSRKGALMTRMLVKIDG